MKVPFPGQGHGGSRTYPGNTEHEERIRTEQDITVYMTQLD